MRALEGEVGSKGLLVVELRIARSQCHCCRTIGRVVNSTHSLHPSTFLAQRPLQPYRYSPPTMMRHRTQQRSKSSLDERPALLTPSLAHPGHASDLSPCSDPTCSVRQRCESWSLRVVRCERILTPAHFPALSTPPLERDIRSGEQRPCEASHKGNHHELRAVNGGWTPQLRRWRVLEADQGEMARGRLDSAARDGSHPLAPARTPSPSKCPSSSRRCPLRPALLKAMRGSSGRWASVRSRLT